MPTCLCKSLGCGPATPINQDSIAVVLSYIATKAPFNTPPNQSKHSASSFQAQKRIGDGLQALARHVYPQLGRPQISLHVNVVPFGGGVLLGILPNKTLQTSKWNYIGGSMSAPDESAPGATWDLSNMPP